MSTPKASIITTLVFLVLLFASMLNSIRQQAYSIDAWKQVVHFHGDVCVVAVNAHNMPYCSNGVRYTLNAVKAQEAYLIWDACEEYDDAAICTLQYD